MHLTVLLPAVAYPYNRSGSCASYNSDYARRQPKGVLHEPPPPEVPLREVLIAADVSPFARRTPFP